MKYAVIKKEDVPRWLEIFKEKGQALCPQEEGKPLYLPAGEGCAGLS